jgi:hypothetical protein
MKPARLRLVVTAVLFIGWIGYLIFLVVESRQSPTGKPIVLSRPQLLVSDFDFIGYVEDAESKVKVTEVIYPRSEQEWRDQKITVTNLGQCKRRPHAFEKSDDVKPDLTGPGLYILPLRKASGGPSVFEVVLTPPSPSGSNLRPGPPRIYPLTKETRAQLEQIHKPE